MEARDGMTMHASLLQMRHGFSWVVEDIIFVLFCTTFLVFN